MKLNFILKGKNNPTKIISRYKPTAIYDFTCTIPIVVNRNDWNADKQQIKLKSAIKNKEFINATLRKLESNVIDKWNEDTINKESINKNWLKDVVNDCFGIASINNEYKIYFIDWIQKFIDESPQRMHKGKIISELTIKQYQVTLNKLKAFEANKKVKLKFDNIDLEFHTNFIFYCKTIENLGNTSIGGHIKNIKMWCRNIELEGYKINAQHKHKSFATISSPTYDVYLSQEEVNQIFNFDFSYDNRLSNARDWFIIGLNTGLRISDFLNHLENINIDKEFIRIVTKKTNATAVIPIAGQVEATLKANNNNLPYKISNQKFNEYIKEICLKVGIRKLVFGGKMNPETKRKETGYFEKWELVSSHICRRTFATLLYGEIPTKDIMAVTTHTSISSFEKYIKTSKEESAIKIANYRKKQLKESENEN